MFGVSLGFLNYWKNLDVFFKTIQYEHVRTFSKEYYGPREKLNAPEMFSIEKELVQLISDVGNKATDLFVTSKE